MHVILPAELEQFVTQQVEQGAFESPVHVICEGLDLLRERQRQLENLQAKLQQAADQLDRGEGIPSAEVFAELRERHQALTSQSERKRA